MKGKRIIHIVLALILAVIIPMQSAFIVASAVTNGDGPYRIVLRYFDPIQITYNIKYPAGDNRGEWTGPEDVPIGGVGTPGAGAFDITSPYVSTQIYCVDPFTPFHSRVSDGNFQWNGGAMADTVSGYVEAAPWNMSGAMQTYGDAVQWIAANGYRGRYTTTGSLSGDDDAESKASVARLKALYPGISPIDREVAVMATKVAIWKTVAGDSVQVLKTTLDNSPAKRAAFDALVNALVEDGKNNRGGGATVTATTFHVEIKDTGAAYTTPAGDYNYYGPMTVEAKLENPRAGAALPDLDKVFLAVSGPKSDGVQFTAGVSNTPINGNAKAKAYGTGDLTAQYFPGGAFNAAGEWASAPFYMAIPKDREVGPDAVLRGDELLVRAMAGTLEVPVAEGTPVVFAFKPAGTDIQDWDAIQAFVGGASGGKNVNLYAEDSWYTGHTTLGNLQISKQVENFSSKESDQEFTFAVYYNTSAIGAPPPAFDAGKRLNLTDYPVRGAFSVNKGNNTFTLKNGSLALIQGLPMEVDLQADGTPDYAYYYWVEEIKHPDHPNFDLEYSAPHFAIKDPALTANDSRIGPFRISTGTRLAHVTVTNTRSTGTLTINKTLAGSPGDWGVGNSTVFSVRVKDVTNNNYLLFKGAGPVYECYGNSGTGDIIKISAAQPVTITNLWTNIKYEIEEIAGPNYSISYQGNGVTVRPGQNNGQITVVNTYNRGTGGLVIKKALAGSPEDWGVDESTVFSVRVKDATNNNYLRFTGTGPAYTCVGNSGSGDIIKISAGQPATITNLWANVRYEVEEISGANFTVTYQGNGAIFTEGQNSTVTVTNTYGHGTGGLIINKKLAGSYEDWGVDESTLFSVRVKDVTNNKYLLFKGTGPVYECYGNSGSSDSSTGDVIKVSAGQPAAITGLWANVAYQVEEISGTNYAITYQGNNVMFAQGQNSTVTVINTYEHGTGNLVIHKKLAGSYDDWGAGESTVFSVRVKDVTNNNYLLFTGTGPEYACYGNSGSSDSSTGDVIKVSAGQPVTVSNLWVNARYAVEELGGDHFGVAYEGNGGVLTRTNNSVVTVINTYEHGTGDLVINKKLAGSYDDWGVDESTVFSVRVKDATNNNYLLFTGTGPNYTCIGNSGSSDSSTGSIIKISAGQPAAITNLWANVRYEVEEISGAHYAVSYQGNGALFTEGQNSTVTVVNTYEHGTGDLVINKKLAGSYDDWGVDEATVFSVRIKDATNNKYLLFTGTGPNYACIGNSNSGDSGTGGIIKISAGQPTTVTNLWANVRYEVEEIGGAHYAVSYEGNNVMFAEGQNSVVTVVNSYEHGTGSLVIHKHLSGNPEDWGVDGATVFTARVKDVTGNNYLLFDLQPDGIYRANGNNGSATPTDNPRELVRFTADGSAELTNLWAGRVYRVEETDGSLYTAAYEGNNVSFPNSGNMVVTVENTYMHGTGGLIISKRLAGSPYDWNVDNTTVFTARVKDVAGNNYLLFERQQDGTYLAVGNNNSPAPTNDPRELVQFTAGSSAELKGLWSGRVYKVEETQGEHYTASYQGNNVSFPEGGNMAVVVTNTYDEACKPKPCLPLIPLIPLIPFVPFIPFIPFIPLIPFIPFIPLIPLIPLISCIDLDCREIQPDEPEDDIPDEPQPIVPAPKTGDSQLIAMVTLVTMLVCFAGTCFLFMQRKKEEEHNLAGAAST